MRKPLLLLGLVCLCATVALAQGTVAFLLLPDKKSAAA
jgi:hypothetical protein